VDNCTATSISGTTKLSGSGSAAKSVMTITGHSQVWLGGLLITQGDNSDSGVGGGINFAGTGTLKISSTTITNNHAGYGGGIQFKGTGSGNDVAELWINYETLITNNTAAISGGGIRIEGLAKLRVVDDQVWIALNHANGGYGGGIEVIGPAEADLGSPGYRFGEYLALLYENTAMYGGGLAVAGGGDYVISYVRLFATDPLHPLRIEGNNASQDGGGIYLRGQFDDWGGAYLCAGGYRITGNSAQEGSAIYTFGGVRDDVYLQRQCGSSALGSVACTSVDCNRIDDNTAQNISGQATNGSTILVHFEDAGRLYADALQITGNHGAHALRVLAGDSPYRSDGHLSTCLLAGNFVTSDLVMAEASTDVSLKNCTIANNSIGSGVVFRTSSTLEIQNSIIAQSGATTLAYGGGNPVSELKLDYILSLETASLAQSQGTRLIQGDAQFVNAPTGDYRLQPTSPAIDLAPPVVGDDRDLDNNPFDQDNFSVPNVDGVRDLGAYERQARYCGTADTLYCNGFDFD